MTHARATASAGAAQQEIESGERFGFGANWSRFLHDQDDSVVAQRRAAAREALAHLLRVPAASGPDTFAGRRALDVGCGSGLMSLALRDLGAEVVSFDFDSDSVRTTQELRSLARPGDTAWEVRSGSALDGDFLDGLGTFDLVYAWGVLHHTGDQWQALDRVARTVAPGGTLVLALYNDQGLASRYWSWLKLTYNRSGPLGRAAAVGATDAWFRGKSAVATTLHLMARRSRPAAADRGRGMDHRRDLIDWVGGLPFEVSRPDDVFAVLRDQGFTLRNLRTAGAGHACNEYVVVREVVS